MLRLKGAQQVKFLRKQLLRGNAFNLVLAGAQLDRSVLVEDLIDGAYLQAMSLDKDLPYTEAEFQTLEAGGQGAVIGRANEMETTLLTVLKLLTDMRQKLTALGSIKWPDTRADVRVQLSHLLGGPFQRDTPAEWLAQYPRYVKAVLQRIERVTGQYPKDQKYTVSLQDLTQPLLSAQAEHPQLLLMSTEAATYRWMLEEFRVSLFAQNLGTRQAVSVKRLGEQWSLVARWLEKNPH